MQRILPSSIVVSILSGGIVVAIAVVSRKIIEVLLSGEKGPLPLPTVCIIGMPRIAWFVLAVLGSALILVKDLYIQRTVVAEIINEAMVLVMLAVAALIVWVLISPIMTLS